MVDQEQRLQAVYLVWAAAVQLQIMSSPLYELVATQVKARSHNWHRREHQPVYHDDKLGKAAQEFALLAEWE